MKHSVPTCRMILGLAQATTLAQNNERELWLVRAQNITSDLLKDGADLSSMQHAVLWVKLAQRWWREDPKRASTWIDNAIEVVEQVPNKETPDEREKRLETARVLLTTATQLDQKFTKRLLTVLTPVDKSAEPQGNGNADALIDVAVAVVRDDPKRAADLGALALRTGAPENRDQMLFQLRRQNAKLADDLFVRSEEHTSELQ